MYSARNRCGDLPDSLLLQQSQSAAEMLGAKMPQPNPYLAAHGEMAGLNRSRKLEPPGTDR